MTDHLPRTALLVALLAATACSSSSSTTTTGTDSGTKPDTGGTTHADSGQTHPDSGQTKADAGHDSGSTAPPPPVCGKPGDVGNSLGIGKYCTTETDCPATAPLCSNIENTDGGKLNTFFCVQVCDGCNTAEVCGSGAVCGCLVPGECGCTPTDCTAIIPDGGIAVCTKDASADGS
jgi:hypothetical protein